MERVLGHLDRRPLVVVNLDRAMVLDGVVVIRHGAKVHHHDDQAEIDHAEDHVDPLVQGHDDQETYDDQVEMDHDAKHHVVENDDGVENHDHHHAMDHHDGEENDQPYDEVVNDHQDHEVEIHDDQNHEGVHGEENHDALVVHDDQGQVPIDHDRHVDQVTFDDRPVSMDHHVEVATVHDDQVVMDHVDRMVMVNEVSVVDKIDFPFLLEDVVLPFPVEQLPLPLDDVVSLPFPFVP